MNKIIRKKKGKMTMIMMSMKNKKKKKKQIWMRLSETFYNKEKKTNKLLFQLKSKTVALSQDMLSQER